MSCHRGLPLLVATLTTSVLLGSDGVLAQDFAGGFAARFTWRGSVDTTFAVSGAVSGVARVFGPEAALAAAVDASNRIVIAGTRDGNFVVTRLSAAGTLDQNFGTNGVASRSFAADAEAHAVAIDSSGRIIVAGTSSGQFALACFNGLGGFCSFGAYSKTTTAFPSSADAWAIAIDSSDRIVVGGSVSYWNSETSARNEMFALARYDSSGKLDSSFGWSGKLLNDAGTGTWNEQNVESISGLAIDSNGRIVAAGTFAAKDVRPRFAVIRFLQNGLRDTTFGPQSTGLVTSFGGCSWMAGCFEEASATSLALQSDGKVVIAGSVRPLNSGSLAYDVGLVRLMSDGSRDSGFGVDGYVRTYGGNYEEARAVKVAGTSLFVAGHSGGQALVARYSVSSGALGTGFGDGVVVKSLCETMSPAFALVIQAFTETGIPTPSYKPVIVGTCFS